MPNLRGLTPQDGGRRRKGTCSGAGGGSGINIPPIEVTRGFLEYCGLLMLRAGRVSWSPQSPTCLGIVGRENESQKASPLFFKLLQLKSAQD